MVYIIYESLIRKKLVNDRLVLYSILLYKKTLVNIFIFYNIWTWADIENSLIFLGLFKYFTRNIIYESMITKKKKSRIIV